MYPSSSSDAVTAVWLYCSRSTSIPFSPHIVSAIHSGQHNPRRDNEKPVKRTARRVESHALHEPRYGENGSQNIATLLTMPAKCDHLHLQIVTIAVPVVDH
jgi:hypothetical protein